MSEQLLQLENEELKEHLAALYKWQDYLIPIWHCARRLLTKDIMDCDEKIWLQEAISNLEIYRSSLSKEWKNDRT